MFENLSDKLQAVFDRLNKRGILNEQDVDVALREVRLDDTPIDVHSAPSRCHDGQVASI